MTDTNGQQNTDCDDNYLMVNDVEIIINDPLWSNIKTIEQVIDSISKNETGFTILLTNDAEIKQLNNDFRDKDKPTNVLSFPCDDDDDYLGDIAIAYETIAQEAKDQNKTIEDHFTHMTVHGLLHLKGYDHITDEEAEEMEALEIKILADLGIENPYI